MDGQEKNTNRTRVAMFPLLDVFNGDCLEKEGLLC
jgi:hypothetical protein